MTQAKMDLTAMLAAQTQGRFFGPQPPEAYDKPTNIVVAGNGIFRVVKTPVALFKAKMSDIPAASRLPGLADMEEGPELLVPKIPLKYLIMALTWYLDVYDKDKTEASILFFWNQDNVDLPTKYQDDTEVKGLLEDGQLVLYCPQQKNSATLSEFHEDGMVTYLREHCTPLCETHSHHTMDAYFSGTDNANENMTQFYGVWGKIKDNEPKFAFRWVCGDKKIDIDPSVLFDIPQIEVKTTVTRTIPIEGFEPVVSEETKYEAFKGPWQRVEAPEEWIAQHSKSWPTYPQSNYQRSHYANKGGAAGGATPSYRAGYDWADDQYQNAYGTGAYDPEADYYAAHGGGIYGGAARSTGFDSVGAGKDSVSTSFSQSSVKKNATNLSEDARTSVDIFLDKEIAGDRSIPEVEELVRHLVEELIDLGYDHIIADAADENTSYDAPYQGFESN